MTWDDLMMKARQGQGIMRYAKPAWKSLQSFRLPVIRPLVAILYAERNFRQIWWPLTAKILYREPLMRYRCASVGRRLQLEGPIPEMHGNGRIEIGDDVRIGDRCTWVVGFKVSENPELIIGNRVSVNYQNLISVAKSLQIGDDTMIAANVQIFDNISHPLSPSRRLRHDPFTLEESAPVLIGKNCWVGTNSIVMRGVTIGDNSVVAAGSIVTKSVPPNTLVAGNPAAPIKQIAED
jgi:acetyltransferase-like isoleucine patch superfamily enzyme